MAKKIASKKVEGLTVRIEFVNGQSVVLDIGDLSEEIIHQATMHGLLQKLGDSYAGCGGDLGLAVAQCTAVRDQLLEGNWNSPGREGKGSQTKRDLIRVLMGLALKEGHDATESQIEGMVDALDKKQLAGIRKDPRVAKELAEIEMQRARERLEASKKNPSGGDEADLLGSIFGTGNGNGNGGGA